MSVSTSPVDAATEGGCDCDCNSTQSNAGDYELEEHGLDDASDARALAKLKRIIEIMKAPNKYTACKACLKPCLSEEGKLEDAKYTCVKGDCPRCGFTKLWKLGLRRQIMKRTFDNETGKWVETLNPKSKLASDIWLREVDWRSYVKKECPKVAEVLLAMSRSERPPNADDGDYSTGNETKTARNLTLESNRGTLIDFLDFFEIMIDSHVYHRNLVSSEHRSKKERECNLRPWTVHRDMDFSENGTIENCDKLQSEHWVTRPYTLFMSVFSFLQVDTWNMTDGELCVGDEVIVDGEIYEHGKERPAINLHSYWAVVKKADDGSSFYTVEKEDGTSLIVGRSRLRLRKHHQVCCAHVSDDKKHDRFAMQHFTTIDMEWMEEYMTKNFPNDFRGGELHIFMLILIMPVSTSKALVHLNSSQS